MKLAVSNPYDQSMVGEIDLVPWPTLDTWLDDATELHRGGALPRWERIAVLRRLANALRSKRDELARSITLEGGKPITDARVEADRAASSIDQCVSELSVPRRHTVPMDLTEAGSGRRSFQIDEPIGPVVAISAFNHPLNLIAHQVGPAVATGCPVLVKPADDTPLTCQLFVDLLKDAGLPDAWCRFAPCTVENAERLATDPRVAFLSFIGSAKVGWMLRTKIAPGTRIALEHGGAAPVILANDADMEAAVPRLLKGAFYHAGQVCVSTQRVFVPDADLDDFIAKFRSGMKALRLGDPLDPETDVGPLIRRREVRRVSDWVNEATQSPESVHQSGEAPSESFYPLTIVVDPKEGSRLATQEVFGPVVSVSPYASLDHAIVKANSLPYAFQSSIFTKDVDLMLRCAEALDASTVMVNDHTAFRVDWMPFAGRRISGLGVGGIGHSMRDMSQTKLVVMQ